MKKTFIYLFSLVLLSVTSTGCSSDEENDDVIYGIPVLAIFDVDSNEKAVVPCQVDTFRGQMPFTIAQVLSHDKNGNVVDSVVIYNVFPDDIPWLWVKGIDYPKQFTPHTLSFNWGKIIQEKDNEVVVEMGQSIPSNINCISVYCMIFDTPENREKHANSEIGPRCLIYLRPQH